MLAWFMNLKTPQQYFVLVALLLLAMAILAARHVWQAVKR